MMTNDDKIKDNVVSLHGNGSCVGDLDNFDTVSNRKNAKYPRMKVAETLTKW
jgi:carbamate kinase